MKDLPLLVWLTQLGLSVVGPLAGFVLLAVWLKDRFGLGQWVIYVGIGLGLICAIDGLRNSLKAMERLSQLLDVPFSRFFSAGDAFTDLPMLRASGISFAPDNALPAVKEAVTHIIPSVFDGGMEQAFRIAAEHLRTSTL